MLINETKFGIINIFNIYVTKNCCVSDNNCKIHNVQKNSYKELWIVLGLNLVLVTLPWEDYN